MTSRTVGIVTLEGFNEIDSFVATRMIDSVEGLSVQLVGPAPTATSMAGVQVSTPGSWSFLSNADAVVLGSGSRTFEHIEDAQLMEALADSLHPSQLVGSQCSGAAILHHLGLLGQQSACTDRLTGPKLEARGVPVLYEAFQANGNVATAGGCLASAYLAYWLIDRLASRSDADQALLRVVPVGEEDAFIERAHRHLGATSAAG